MFSSKILPCLKNTIQGVQKECRIIQIFMTRHFSNIVPIDSQPVPDKLYKEIQLELRGHDKAVLKSYGEFSAMAAQHLGIPIDKHMDLRKAVHNRLTLLRSVHVHKKHRVQYETRTYFRFLNLLKLTGSTADTFLEYIERNLPEGVAMKVTKVEIRKLPESIRPPPIETETPMCE